MLREIRPIAQLEGEPKRKWFSDDYFDLIVWLDETDTILEFRLCYDILYDQRVLLWREDSGFCHQRVDNGEGRPGKHKATPILVPDGILERQDTAEKFRKESLKIEEKIATFVYEKIMQY
jgi:hypothetical protein